MKKQISSFFPIKVFICAMIAALALAQDTPQFGLRRGQLVADHIVANGVTNTRVIASMRSTLRHEFVSKASRKAAYQDTALPIGHGQTISSPYIVARMTEQLDPQPSDRVLEIGTGSGYQAAVLAPLVKEVFSIEIVPELGTRAKETLERLGYENVNVRVGDGYKGWPEHAPFDKIIVTCSPERIPQALSDQLVEGGRLVIPVGERYQQVLYRFTKTKGKLKEQRIESTFFVPMTGEAESKRQKHVNEANPKLVNGGFEEKTVKGEPKGWYYVRNGQIVDDAKCPQGIRCLEIKRTKAERALALQPIGIDTAKVDSLAVTLSSKGQGIKKELFAIQSSQLVIEFYDEDRNICGDWALEVPAGSFDWTRKKSSIEVPKHAKLAMVELGLFGGATGTIYFDNVHVAATANRTNK